MGKAQFKRVSVKKLSVRKRSVKNGSVFAGSGLKVKRTVEGGFTFVDVSGEVCPFDNSPCMYGKEFINSCDYVVSLLFGFDVVEEQYCSRAVVKVRKK